MLLFIDTEFSDFIDAQLISIGLISEDGRHEFYGERNDVPEADCSAFVRSNVLPLLGPADQRVSGRHLADRLRRWLNDRGSCAIVVDFRGDWDLLVDLLGYRLPAKVHRKPVHLGELLLAPVFEHERAEYFRSNGLHEHNALHDARANRRGWLALSQETRQQHLDNHAVGDIT